MFLGGEAGVGKTALLRRFCFEHPEAEVHWGACERLFTPRALGPFVDIAESSGGDLARLAEGGAAPHELVRELVAALGVRPPTVVVIEDVHWADEGTLDAVKLLARRLPDLPLLVLASFRDDQLAPADPLQLVLGELVGVRGVERLRLPLLSRAAVGAMASPLGADGDRLFERTGGNPFFVTEVLAAGDAEVPATVRDAVLARAAHLRRPARRLLDAAAVVPAHAELWLLDAIAPAELAHLDQCLGSGMLRADGRFVAFRHELARAAVEDAIAPHRRVELHRSVLAALSRPRLGSVDPARLSHHAEAAGDQSAVLEYAPAAGARAARLGAHRQAAEQYARALRHADVLPPEQQAELYDRLAVERHLLGDGLDEALAAAQAALSIRRSLGQRAEEADALRFSARVLWFMGRTREAKAAALEAVAILETLPPGAKLARAYAGLARIENLAYRLDAARAWSLKAIDLAQELGALEIMSSALNSLGSVQLSVGDEEGWTSLERSLELARASDSEDDVARALLNRASLALELHRYACAERFFAQAMTYTDGRELWSYRGFMLGLRARLHLDRGQWDAALADAEVALRSARSFPVSRVTALSVIGLVSARRGQSDHWPALDEALSLAAPDELQQIAVVAAARAEAAWLGRDYEAVADFTELAYPVACERRAARFAGELAYWRFKAGIVEDVPTWLPEPYALHIRGDWLAAALRWLELGCPYEAALALTESDEVEPTRRGLEEFHRLGALPAARAATARLRRLGATVISRGPRRATLSSPAQLTRRQLEIVQLLVDGLTNAQIAAHLYISPKTVDHHVSAVLGKLGVRSRKDAAAEAVRLGIVGPIAS